MREAFHVATTGRPGPVLIDLPKNVQLAQTVPDYDAPMNLPGYHVEQYRATPAEIAEVAALISRAKRPMIYAGGGVIASGASPELIALVRKTGIPVTTTIMGLGAFPGDDPLSLSFLGMHGTVYANYAVDNCDLLLALGVRFDDRVTGKVSEFAARATIVHIDVDPSEINKIKKVQFPICSDVKYALAELNKVVQPPGRSGRVASQDRRLEEGRPAGLRPRFRRHPAAARPRFDLAVDQGPRRDHLHGRGPAPDVGGPVLQVPPSRGAGSPASAWARWVSACPPRWAPRPPIPSRW